MKALKIRRLRVRQAFLNCLLSIPFNFAMPDTVSSQQGLARPPLVVKNDIGGPLRARVSAFAQLQVTSRPVRIIGHICYSTCTLYVGLPETCISPETVFGFHGPSSFGKPLDPDSFERASRLIAAHYPEPLRTWYLKTARHEISGLFKVKGSVLINLGIAQCQSPAN